MTPPTVNAYYSPSLNEIVFPAGILQPPFFDPNADDAVNYGAMGAVIGHEMTHGFDDQGRQFDAQGNLRDWWTPEDADEVQRAGAARRRSVQRATPSSTSTTHVNGKLTLGENIADLGGLKIAYSRWRRRWRRTAASRRSTASRRSSASSSAGRRCGATLQRDEATKAQVNSDPHAPAKWRVNGPLEQHAGVQGGVGLQGRRPDGAAGSAQARIW